MTSLEHTYFLSPHHYYSYSSIEHIQSEIEDSCRELDIDFSYESYTYFCTFYYKYRQICMWIHLYYHKSSGKHIIEFQEKSGDTFGYYIFISKLRMLFQEKKIIIVQDSLNEIDPYQEKDASPEYIRYLFESVQFHVESIYTLAILSLNESIKQYMADEYVFELLMKLSLSEDINIHRCALSIIINLIESDDSELIIGYLKKENMAQHINYWIHNRTNHQIKRLYNLIYPFLE